MTDDEARELMAGADPVPAIQVQPMLRLFDGIKHLKARRFLSMYAQGLSLRETSRQTGIQLTYHYLWKRVVPGYAEAFDKATELRADVCEDEIFQRGIMGYYEELTYKGKKTHERVRKYSDVLAIVAAKALRPHRYRENTTNKVIVNMPVSFQLVMPQLERPAPQLIDVSDSDKKDLPDK